MMMSGINPKDGQREIDVCVDGRDYDRLTLYIKDCAAMVEKNALLESLLIEIGDYAYNASTGPAVPDALWDIRKMAYQQ